MCTLISVVKCSGNVCLISFSFDHWFQADVLSHIKVHLEHSSHPLVAMIPWIKFDAVVLTRFKKALAAAISNALSQRWF